MASTTSGGGGSTPRKQALKLCLAAALLLVAAGVFSWYQGWILAPKPEPAPGVTAQQKAAMNAEEARVRDLQKRGVAVSQPGA